MFKKIIKWLDLNIGWFFVNGRKREAWERHIRGKYKKDI